MATKKLKDTELKRKINDALNRSYTGTGKNVILGDGGGLYLYITKKATASFLYRYFSEGKARTIGLGGYPSTSLATAREKAENFQKSRAAGVDPIAQLKEQASKKRHECLKAKSFETCAFEYIEHAKGLWKNPKHKQQWVNTLTQYAFPVLGKTPVAQVDKEAIVKVLIPIWTTKQETASRLRGRIEMVLDWAKANDMRTGDNPATYKGNLQSKLPRIMKEAEPAHHPSLHFKQLPKFISDLHELEDISRYALEFLILCASRTSEVTQAVWDEFDLSQNEWTIPGSRMKAKLEHKVPLSKRAVEILCHVRSLGGEKYVFNSRGKDKPISNMAMAMLCRRMGYNEITVHGFRSTFRTWAGQNIAYSPMVCEHALSHRLPNEVERTYLRTNFLEKRAELMQDWSDFALSAVK